MAKIVGSAQIQLSEVVNWAAGSINWVAGITNWAAGRLHLA
jgi:hypothetical protein